MRKVEEYIVLRDGSSTLRLAKLDCHSILRKRGIVILRHSGAVETYELASIHTHKGETKDVIEYELGKCLRCIKLEDSTRRVAI